MISQSKERQKLGDYLRQSRLKLNLSQADVAKFLGVGSAQSVSDWERGYGSLIPIPYLKKLIKHYGLAEDRVYEMILDFQFAKIESKLKKEFYGKSKSKKPDKMTLR
jgi:transcriptional regulator with XRE-family HTH domain